MSQRDLEFLSRPSPLFPRPSSLIVVHPRENRHKCTVEPLRKDPRFEFHKHPKPLPEPVENMVRLGLEGPLLSPEDLMFRLVILDATWRWVKNMERRYAGLMTRRLLPWKTAYPRISKFSHDPDGGLATIEAVFAAYHQLGLSTTGILDSYHWREEFLTINRDLLKPIDHHSDSSG